MADAFAFNLSSLDGSNGFTLNGSGTDFSGASVSNAGDFNNDGIDDLIIGAPSAISSAGQSYVVFGSTNSFTGSLDLSSLDGSNGFTLNGSGTNFSGNSVSSAGDINNDGIDDLIIGAESAASGAGQSYVVFGSSSNLSASLDLSSLDGSNGFTINGINSVNSDGISDSSGRSVSSAGDINNDGIDDLIIGAPSAASGAGHSYVVFGSSGFTASFNLSSLDGSNGFTLNGDGIDSSGNSVSNAGDVNGDTIDDLIIGAQGTGRSYVVFGSSSFDTSFDLSSLDGSNGFTINGINDTDSLGTSVSSAGDVNGDTINDLIIGAPGAASGAGQSYVVFGNASGFDANFEVSSLDGSNGFAINGINDTDFSGISVSGAGDVNDDDIADLIIGASNAASGAGQSYVVFGSSSGFDGSLDLSNLDPENGFAINGINDSDASGTSVSAAGDIDGDGADDLLVGAPGAISGAGQSYVIFGTPQPEPPEPPEPPVIFNLSSLDGSNGFTLNGSGTDFSGASVSNAGDFNNDGIDDLIIGAPSAISSAGQSYVVFGSTNSFTGSLDLSSLDGSNGFTLNGSGTNFSGNSVSSAGDINNDGIDDLIIGAESAASGAGQSYVVFGSSSTLSASLDLSSLDGSNGFTINGINSVNSDGISDSSGRSVSSAGDINNDGIDDLIIGAPSAASGAGHSYVVFGSSGFTASFNLSSLDGSNGFTLNGDGIDSSGNSVSNAGDVNGDTIDDLIIGAQGTGRSYVVFGSSSFDTSFDLSSLDGSNGFTINGINDTDSLGTSVSSAGDVNGDTINDLIIGAPGAASGAGQSYVVFGNASGFDANFEVSSLDGSNGFAINGINDTDFSGISVSGAGDVNDDDIADLIIGASNAASGAGQSYVVFGSSSGFDGSLDLSNLDPENGFAINGINDSDASGTSVSAAGDINGDGADDLLVGASGAASGAGQSYVIFGTPQPEPPEPPEPPVIFNLSSLDGSNGFTLNGSGTDFSGASVSNAGDFNNDGIDDLIIGAPSAISSAGQSYVVFGSTNSFTGSLDLSSLDGSNGFTLNGSGTNFSGNSVSSAGDINNDGIDDLIIGAESAASGAGQSYVVFGSSSTLSASLDLSSLDGSNGFTINGINSVNSDGISDSSGRSVSSAGDINNDGIDDLIIGAPSAASGAGHSYVVFGSSGFTASFNLSSLDGSNGFTLNGDGIDSSGNSVSNAGDVNGDTIDDLIIGAQGTGRSYVVFGSSSFDTSFDLSSLDGSNGFTINGINDTDSLGTSVSSAGDVNGDTINDLIIGAPGAASGAGQSYVVFGNASGFDANFEVSSLDGSNGFAINGINDTDFSGISVSGAGDVNDDDIADLIIGASNAASGAGQSYVVFGSSSGFDGSLDLSNLDPENGFAINGINDSDASGTSVSAAGDINGDGADDLLVGASGAASGAGQSYVIFGTPQPEPPEPVEPPEPLELTSSGDVFNITGGNDNVTLEVAITSSSSSLVNEFGVYTVDDATGNIDGIAPGEAGYARQALERGQVLFSAIANPPNGFSNISVNSLLELPSDTNLRFYLVRNSTTENVLTNVTPITDVLLSGSSNQRITTLGDDNAFSLAWEDGFGNSTNDFQNLVVRIQATDEPLPLGTSLQGQPQGELIDLRDVQQRVRADFVVNREAAFNNFVGFYRVANENGGIDTNNDGQADILVGQAGYAQAAVRQRVAGIDLSVNNQGTASSTGIFEPGSIFAPFIIVDGRADAILDSNSNNDPAIYFSFLGANADRVDHIRLLGNNTFGFEDLTRGGDNDFNDVIVRANLSIV